MKKTIAAVTAGLLLVAGQAAAAQNNSAVARVGDRIGAGADASSEIAGIPLPVLIAGIAIVVAAAVVINEESASA